MAYDEGNLVPDLTTVDMGSSVGTAYADSQCRTIPGFQPEQTLPR